MLKQLSLIVTLLFCTHVWSQTSTAGLGVVPNSNNTVGLWNGNLLPSSPAIGITTDQKVGIGTDSANLKLVVQTVNANDGISLKYNNLGFLKLHPNSLSVGSYNPITKAGDAGIFFGGGTDPGQFDFGFVLAPWNNADGGIRINKDGRVAVGTATTAPGFKLFVEEGIRTRKIKVDQASWPDYVFDSTYKLLPLSEVERFIQDNKHLPDVPNAAEIESNGVDLGNNQAILLKKIEELTLYLIELKKENEKLHARISKLEAEAKNN